MKYDQWLARAEFPVAMKPHICRPRVPKDWWDVPDDLSYTQSPEVDYLCFVAGIMDAFEAANR